MILLIIYILLGLGILIWSADKFVEGASGLAKYYGVPPLIIGMVIIGFGTSAPELVVSAFSSLEGNPGVALGNAYGSNTTNIGLILGLTALFKPIAVHSEVLRKELPILLAITLGSAALLFDLTITSLDAWCLLFVFAILMSWTLYQAKKGKTDALAQEVDQNLSEESPNLKASYFNLALGLLALIASSRLLVYGAVEVAQLWGVPDLIIGLTVVAIGTSLPELASSIVSIRKGESDIALGNIIGSNLFNTLAVVGLAGILNPLSVLRFEYLRDISVMTFFTFVLFIFCIGIKGPGRINRIEGAVLSLSYLGYVGFLILW